MARTSLSKDGADKRLAKELDKLESEVLALRERFDEALAAPGNAGQAGGEAAGERFSQLRERINAILASLAEDKTGVAETLRNGVERGQQAFDDVRCAFQGTASEIETTIRARPFQSAAICLAAGALLALAWRR